MNNIWSLDIQSKKISLSSTSPDLIYWHESVFKGYKEGIVDRGGNKELAELFSWSEVNDIHTLIKTNPNDFFNTQNAVWCYTGKVGEAADFIGFKESSVLIGEIKWQEGWSKRLLEQMPRYVSNHNWIGYKDDKKLELFIACPQTASRSLITELANLDVAEWQSVKVHFGFMQLGWLKQNTSEYFFKVIWAPCNDWNETLFDNLSEIIGLHG